MVIIDDHDGLNTDVRSVRVDRNSMMSLAAVSMLLSLLRFICPSTVGYCSGIIAASKRLMGSIGA